MTNPFRACNDLPAASVQPDLGSRNISKENDDVTHG